MVKQRSLYSILGVKKDATLEYIKSAYRRKALETHPDRGGSAEKFREVSFAYEILKDPARRAHYDKTGEAKDKVEEGKALQASAIVNILVPLYFNVLDSLLNSGQDPKRFDVVHQMQALLQQQIEGVRATEQAILKRKNALEDSPRRFDTPEGVNIFAQAAEQMLATIERDLRQITTTMLGLRAAQQFLNRCKYKFEMPPKGGSSIVFMLPSTSW